MNELKQYRKETSLTQKEMARLLEVSQEHCSREERAESISDGMKLRLKMVIQQDALKQIRTLSTEQIIRNLAAGALGELE